VGAPEIEAYMFFGDQEEEVVEVKVTSVLSFYFLHFIFTFYFLLFF
jgi:Ca2+-dependent lipid-binding protein